jgi:hypothetical protein
MPLRSMSPADGPGDPGTNPVGADHERRRDRPPPAVAAAYRHAGDASGPPGHDTRDREPALEPRAGFDGRGQHDGVELVASQCDQEVDAGAVLDRPPHRGAVGEMEGDRADRRRSAVHHRVEQPPAGQLDHAAAGDRVGRQRVAREVRPVDDEDLVALASQQHRRRRPGTASAHDDHRPGLHLRFRHGLNTAEPPGSELGDRLESSWIRRPGSGRARGVACAAVPAWKAIEQAEPDFAARVRRLFDAGRHKTIATLRADGSPRISGIECEFTDDGDLRFGSMTGARKGADLRRDPRFALHGPTFHPEEGKESEWPGEAKIAGRATPAGPVPAGDGGDGGDAGGQPEGEMFVADITEVVITGLNAEASLLVVESWTPERGLRRVERA